METVEPVSIIRRTMPDTTRLPRQYDPYAVHFLDRPALALMIAILLALATLILLRLGAPLEIAMSDAFFRAIDCKTLGLAADGPRCGFFPARESEFWQTVRDIGFKGPLILIGLTVLWRLWPRKGATHKTPQSLADVLLGLQVLLIASIGLVNFVIKPVFGRPRPKALEMFGRDAEYVLPGSLSDQCTVNCSFVSGEAATAFCLVVFAICLLSGPWRWIGVVFATLLASFISMLRVSFGGHFFSDVVMSVWVVVIVTILCAWWLQSPRGTLAVERLCGWLNAKARRT